MEVEGVKPTHASAFLVWCSAPTRDVRKLIELGSGNGIVSLAIAKLYDLHVEGVEVQKHLYDASVRAVELNSLHGKVRFHNLDVRDVASHFPRESFDMVVANVPFHRGKPSPTAMRQIARGATFELINAFVDATAYLLRNRGTFVFVCGEHLTVYLVERLTGRRLIPQRMVLFTPKVDGRARLVALRGRKNGRYGLVIQIVTERRLFESTCQKPTGETEG